MLTKVRIQGDSDLEIDTKVKSIVTIDLATYLTGNKIKTDEVNLKWIVGKFKIPTIYVIFKTDQILNILDGLNLSAIKLIGLTPNQPTITNTFTKFPSGFRSGRDLRETWLEVAIKEGIITEAITFYPNQDDKTQLFRSDVIEGEFQSKNPITTADLENFIESTSGKHSSLILEINVEQFDFKEINSLIQNLEFDHQLEYQLKDCWNQFSKKKISFINHRFSDFNLVNSRIGEYWHGSPIKGIKDFNSQNKKTWFSPSPVFAGVFGIQPDNQKGHIHGIEECFSKEPEHYLYLGTDYKILMKKSFSLYKTKILNNNIILEGNISNYEYTTKECIEVIDAIEYKSFYEFCDENNILLIDNKTSNFELNSILKKFKMEEDFFHHWELELKDALKIKALYPQFYFWLLSRKILHWNEVEPQLSNGFLGRFIHREIGALLGRKLTIPEFGYHGIEHFVQTAAYAFALSIEESVNPIAPLIAGGLHDCGRTLNSNYSSHASKGVINATNLLNSRLNFWVLNDEIEKILDAIKNHSTQLKGENTIESICWDSDRLRLAWERGYNPKYFSTKSGNYFANNESDILNEKLKYYFNDYIFRLS
jgi:HD superfamily phosphohydrolase YqeK